MEFGEFGVPVCVCVCVCVNVPLFESHFLLRRLIPSGSPPSLSGGDAGAHRTPESPLRRLSGGDSGTLRPRSASGPALRRLTGGDSGTLRPRSASGPGSRLASSTPEHSGATPTPGPT